MAQAELGRAFRENSWPTDRLYTQTSVSVSVTLTVFEPELGALT